MGALAAGPSRDPPFEGFDAFKADVMAQIDPEFRRFLQPGVAHEIRLEEIFWGGVHKDGIPALTNPAQRSRPRRRPI